MEWLTMIDRCRPPLGSWVWISALADRTHFQEQSLWQHKPELLEFKTLDVIRNILFVGRCLLHDTTRLDSWKQKTAWWNSKRQLKAGQAVPTVLFESKNQKKCCVYDHRNHKGLVVLVVQIVHLKPNTCHNMCGTKLEYKTVLESPPPPLPPTNSPKQVSTNSQICHVSMFLQTCVWHKSDLRGCDQKKCHSPPLQQLLEA